MTPNAPTWAQVRSFLQADDWREVKSNARGGSQSDHIFFEKALPDGRLLQTHISHAAKKSMSAGRFQNILRLQLEVSASEFWEALRTSKPVDRPVVLEAPLRFEHQAWVVAVLVGQLHMDPDELSALTSEEAEALIHRHWNQNP